VSPELRGVIDKTAGAVPTLRIILRAFDQQTACAFVYGSNARSEEHAQSDIDLMMVGNIGLAELAPALRKSRGPLGPEVNVTNYSAVELRN
jgi:predicted nucleotidyltransferase